MYFWQTFCVFVYNFFCSARLKLEASLHAVIFDAEEKRYCYFFTHCLFLFASDWLWEREGEYWPQDLTVAYQWKWWWPNHQYYCRNSSSSWPIYLNWKLENPFNTQNYKLLLFISLSCTHAQFVCVCAPARAHGVVMRK